MARRQCSEWKTAKRGIDEALGLPRVAIRSEARQAILERARLLAMDPSYPPPHVVNAVAELMTRHVQI